MQVDPVKFGYMLREKRDEKGLLQKDIEKTTGIVSTLFSNYENGIKIPNIKNLIKICVALNVDLNYFHDCIR